MYLRLFLLSLSFILSIAGQAQAHFKIYPKVTYLDKDKLTQNSEEEAYFVRKIDQINGQLMITEYFYPGMKIHMNGFIISENPIKYHGVIKWYFANDSLEHIAQYHLGDKIGSEIFYFENGQKKEELLHEGKTRKTIQIWQEDGAGFLTNGTGHVVELDEKRQTEMHSGYQDSLLVERYEIRKVNSDTIYLLADSQAEFKSGMPAFYKQIANILVYPKSARKKGIEGRVYVLFIVNKEGEMEEIEVVKGIDPMCDLEAENAVKSIGRGWIPSSKNGKPVKTRMVLPINFKLG